MKKMIGRFELGGKDGFVEAEVVVDGEPVAKVRFNFNDKNKLNVDLDMIDFKTFLEFLKEAVEYAFSLK